MPYVHEMGEAEWERLIHQLRTGDCTPFLGSGACAGVLPTGTVLSRRMARKWGYPYDDDHELPRVAQFAVMRYGDAVYVKKLVCDELGAAEAPDFRDPLEPHRLLSEFPLPVYLTTNYDDFVVRSLRAAGKDPNTAVCPWNEGMDYDERLFGSQEGWNPRPQTPLVYHLHGSLHDPASIVLAEDDYLEFLTSLAVEGIGGGRRMLPTAILAALTRRPLLFVGYSLQDWTFRVLFRGLLRAVPGINRRRHVSVQLAPSLNTTRADVLEVQRQLARYHENWRISIFWGSAEDFCTELRRRMGTTS
ncbi:SIR2 family NAD-dependent protein deacylase [Planobispora takensis]|uniref:SIR2 family NAD-dependent protein deacylase n=1 Tax=Planobispora takensis TaxID=1367882 RepID=UPI0035E5ED79